MTGIVFHTFLGLIAFGVVNHVSAIICLSCHDISEPSLCEYYDVCEADEVCSVQQYLQENEIKFSVGCHLKNRCTQSYRSSNSSLRSTDKDILCHDCCTGDFCNSGGCGAPGFPVMRGPICYNCDKIRTGSICHRISVCGQHEECYYSEQSKFGNMLVTSKCQRTHICDALRGEATVVGRRQTDETHNCVKCCTTDLCNGHCKEDNETTTLAPIEVTKSTTSEKTTSPVDAAASSTEHRYMIMFLINYGGNNGKYLQIVLASESAGWCIFQDNFHNTARNVTLTQGINSFNLTSDIVMDKNVIENKLIIIDTSVQVSVYSFNFEQYTSDGVVNFPTSQCSTRYIVPSYEAHSSYSSVFGLGSLHNYNAVSITLRLTSGTVDIDGHSYSNGDTVNMTLQENETFQFASYHDLTGTEILSSKPVCVVSGVQCADVADMGCSHLSEMILPVQDFSYIFIIPILQTWPTVVVRVLAKEDQTILTFKNGSSLLSSKDDQEFTLSGTYSHSLLSDKPVLVMMYAASMSDNPFMMTIPSVMQYLSDYVFAVVDAGFTSYLSVIVQVSKADGLRLDNHILAPISNSVISIDINGTQYTSFSVSVSPGYHRMLHTHNETFGLFVYGNRDADGYGYPAGLHL